MQDVESYQKVYVKNCHICADYFDIYKTSEVYHSDTDSEYVPPISIKGADNRPNAIITRSVSRRIAKNEILKRIFHGKVHRYPLRSRMHHGLDPKPNYYESEDSDAELKKLEHISRRRHSVGAIWGTRDEKSSRKWTKRKKRIENRRYSENLALASKTGSQSDTDDSDDENHVIKEKATVDIENKDKPKKIICFTCHLRKLLNLPLIENCAKKTVTKPKKINQRRKSEPNRNRVEDKGQPNKGCTHSEGAADTKVKPKRRESESATSHVTKVECCKKSEAKNHLKVADERGTGRITVGCLSAPITQERQKSHCEGANRTQSKDMDKGVNSAEKPTSKSETKKIPQIRMSAAPTLYVSEVEKSEQTPKDVDKREKSIERPTIASEAKKISQRRMSAATMLYVSEVEKSDERSKDMDKRAKSIESSKSEPKKIVQRRRSVGSVLHTSEVRHSEKSETKMIPKEMDRGVKSTEIPLEYEVKKIYQRRKSAGPTFNVIQIDYKQSEAKRQMKDSEKKERSTEKHATNSTSKNIPSPDTKREESSGKSKAKTQSKHMDQSRKSSETPISKLMPQKISPRRKFAGPTSHIKEVEYSKKSEYTEKREKSTDSHKSKPAATTLISKGGERSKNAEKPPTKSDPRQVLQNRCSESKSQRSSSDSITNSETNSCPEHDKQTKSSRKTSRSSTSHRGNEPISKNTENKRNSTNKADKREKSNEKSSTSHKSKDVSEHANSYKQKLSELHSEKRATPESKKVTQRRKLEHNKEKEYSKNIEPKTHSKEMREKSSENLLARLGLKKISPKRKLEEEESSVKEKEYSRGKKKASDKGHLTPEAVPKKVNKNKRSASEESHKVEKVESKNTQAKKCSIQHHDKQARSSERPSICSKTGKQTQNTHSNGRDSHLKKETTLTPKRVSFESKTENTLKPILKKVANRRKSESAASTPKSDGFKEYTPNEKQKQSCEKISLVKKCHEETSLGQNAGGAVRSRRTFNLNITLGESGEDRTKLSPVISIHSIASSDDEANPVDEVFLTPEEQLKEIFHDTMELEQAREELIRILDTSSENLGAACEKSLISDMVQSCLNSYSSKNGASRQIVTVVDNCGKHPKVLGKVEKESEPRNIVTRESHSTDTQQDQTTDTESDEEHSDMTKMEHYKKRLIQQHEKPTITVSSPATTEEDDSSSQSPFNSNQSGHQQKKKEEAVQSKVARKRSICRSKFRHQNLEFFKLGNSIPTSLCKTKEPYNICAGKNLQMCNQNQNNKKCEENVIRESITESIINTMEGNKRKDILWRSVSLSNEQQEKKTKSLNSVVDNVKNNSGRHILPAIVPEIPDRRKGKTSNARETRPSANEKADKINKKVETDLVIRKADPVSINKRKAVVKRRKTVIGIENSETDSQSMDAEPVSDFSDVPIRDMNASPALLRRKSVSAESEILENTPINLSLKKNEHSAPHVTPSTGVPGESQQPSVKQILQNYSQAKSVAGLSAVPAHNNEIERNSTTAQPTTPQSMSVQNQEPARNYISEPNGDHTLRPRTLQSLLGQNHESANTYVSAPNESTSLQNFKAPEHHTARPPASQSLSVQSHESARNYISAPNGPSAALQNHESTRNYFVGPGKPPSSSGHEPTRKYMAGMSKPHVASSQNYESGRNFAAGTSKQSVAASQNHESIRNSAAASNYSLRSQESARNYFAPQSASGNNGAYYHRGDNFPEIQQQMMRLDNANATVPHQNHLMPRKEKPIQQDAYRSVNHPPPNHEEVIKTIIQLVKSSMDPIFSVEILLILNKWYMELKAYYVQPGLSKKTKTAIMRTLNEILFYISDKLFAIPCNLLTRNYVEQIIQIVSPQHKDLFNRLLPMLSRKYNDEVWMSNFFKLLTQSPLPDAGEHNQRPNVPNNHPNPGYSVPVSNHNFPQPPQNYRYENYLEPPLPYQGFNCQPNNSLPGNYLQNMEHHRNGMLLPPYPNNHLEAAAIEMQMKQQQNIQAMYQNAPQNFPRPDNYNISASALARPKMYLADNRCVPPNYGSNPNLEQQMLHHLPEQNKVSKYKSKKKDRLDIIPITPPNSSAAMAVPNNQAIHGERTPVTNKEDVNEQGKEMGKPCKKQKKNVASKKTKTLSRQNSETSTSSSNITDHNTAPDVEELLQTNFIYNKSKTDHADVSSSMPVITKMKSTTTEPSMTNVAVDKGTVENVIINVINNSETNQLEQEKANFTIHTDNTNETNHAVSSTVIVKDKSMEITRGNSYRDLSLIASTVDKNVKEIANDIVLEKVDLSEETNATSTSTLLDDKRVIKENLEGELYDLSNKMREKLLLCGDDSPEVKLRIIREVFGDKFKEEYEDVIQVLLFKKVQGKRGALKVDDDVIMIDDDEDIEVENVPKKEEDEPPRLIKLLPLKRKEGGDEKLQYKKLRTAPNDLDSKDVVIIVDEEKEDNASDKKTEDILSNSDCNQNYITTIDQNINVNVETAVHKSEVEPNPDCNMPVDETSSAPERLVETSVVANVAEITDSPIVNKQPQAPTIVPETPLLEDISSDEDTKENFCLRNHYEKKLSGTTLDTLEVSEVSHCDLINDTVDSIDNASNHEFFEKPLVYTRPVTPKKARKYSTESETTTSTVSRCSNEPESAVEIRKWNSLANITHFEEDDTLSSSYVNVQPSWDQNYSHPKNTEETDILPTPPYRVPVSPSVSSHFLQDSRYPRVSPVASPNKRFSPNFKSPNRSVPASPSFSLVSIASSVVPTSPVVSATSPVGTATSISPVVPATTRVVPMAVSNSSVNWQDWFTQEKRKGFFNFSRSQSVESEHLRQSGEMISSAGSDYCPKVPLEDNYCEIKIDSKTYRIKKNIYEKIPKGKLCYIRDNNTFIRYFDGSQMELFIRNLNVGEGSSIASDLLKQIKGRVEGLTDIETSLGHYKTSGKSEVITVAKDVTFSTEDYLSDPELYVDEVEKVQRFVPKDFYGFYKYVTGYQIVNHHPPISFQTFLTMHNTNGIRGLFKSYVNTLIEGHAVL